MTRVTLEIPGLRVRSEANERGHWSRRHARFHEQRTAVALALAGVSSADRDALRSAERVEVRFTRIAPRKCDPDNALGGFKAVLDEVARWLRIDDGSGRILLELPRQEKGGYGVVIELEAA